MTYNDLEKANSLKKKIENWESAIGRIEWSMNHQDTSQEAKTIKRLFVRLLHKCEMSPGVEKDVAFVFFPERLHGVEIDLEEEFVLLLLDWLRGRVKKAKEEFEQIGK